MAGRMRNPNEAAEVMKFILGRTVSRAKASGRGSQGRALGVLHRAPRRSARDASHALAACSRHHAMVLLALLAYRAVPQRNQLLQCRQNLSQLLCERPAIKIVRKEFAYPESK